MTPDAPTPAGAAFPTLHTARLLLREITLADAPALFAIHGDWDAMRHFGTEPVTTLAQAEHLVAVFAAWRQTPNPGTRWGIVRQDTGALIGSCGLFKWNRGWGTCTIGYELARSAWGQGHMTEALRAILPWGFEHMALRRVEAQVHPDNTASLKLLTRLGFATEGRQREAGYWGGQVHDMVGLGLLQREWR
jgi:ribosomal-protein-alanine N-acetyltransferase